jgi:HK97 gp10 family phage protein
MSKEYEIVGLSDLLKQLKELPQVIEKKCLRNAMRAGAQIIRKAAQDLAPKRTGLLSKAVRVVFKHKLSKNGRVVYNIYISKKPKVVRRGVPIWAFYWRFVEFGTPKMGAKPFLQPAFDATNREAASVIRGKLAERIEIEVRRRG